LGDGQHLRGHVLGQAMGQGFAVGVDDFGHAGDLGGSLRGGASVVASDEHMHVTTAGGGSRDGVEGRALDGRVVVFGNHKGCHVGFLEEWFL